MIENEITTGNCTFCLYPPIAKFAENDDDDNGDGSKDYDYTRDDDGNNSIHFNSCLHASLLNSQRANHKVSTRERKKQTHTKQDDLQV
jgi:hypothetical protein